MALLIRMPRWRGGVGRRMGAGVLLAPQLGHGDEGRCISLMLLTPSWKYTLKIPERDAGHAAHRMLEIGGVLPPMTAAQAEQAALAFDWKDGMS